MISLSVFQPVKNWSAGLSCIKRCIVFERNALVVPRGIFCPKDYSFCIVTIPFCNIFVRTVKIELVLRLPRRVSFV